jgi:hypothetical protein
MVVHDYNPSTQEADTFEFQVNKPIMTPYIKKENQELVERLKE